MRRAGRTRSIRQPKAERPASPDSRRIRLAMLLALVTVVCLGSTLFLSQGTTFLMPGPLASAHGAIENCSACHTKSGSGKLSWVHGLVAGDSLADSKACLTCHKMPNTAFNAHSTSAGALKRSTERLTKIAAGSPAPQSARAQNIAFPTHDVVARGLYCATCHQEHQGVHVSLNKISNERCRSCHVVKFDSFDGHHPKFENYPFKRRTRIIYDHAGHFDKHFPEVAKKHPARRIPATCSTCHDSREDKRVMAVAPFEQTCSGCHLDQIIGKERASGPKGIAFLTLPGLDLQTLKQKNASIGEWPAASEAELTPFMKVMISRNERGRALVETVDGLNLQDLTSASDDQIKAVTNLVWEIKGLFYALITGKASDVLADLDIGGAKLSVNLVADLTASIPRDVVISAHQQWLPNLAIEMANGRDTSDQNQSGWSTAITVAESASAEEPSGSDAGEAAPSPEAEVTETASIAKLDPPVCSVGILGQCLVSKGRGDEAGAAKAKAAEPEGAAEKADTANAGPNEAASADAASKAEADAPADGRARAQADSDSAAAVEEAEKAAEPEGAAGRTDAEPDEAESADASEAEADAQADGQAASDSAAATEEAEKAAEPEASASSSDTPNTKPDNNKETLSADEPPKEKAADQTDDLLFPTKDELRAIEAHIQNAERAAAPEGVAGDAPADSDIAAAEFQTDAALVTSIESDVDPESWAEHGGWYRQDYAIFYRPTGHADKFIYSWLSLTGPQAPKGDTSPAAAVFDFLTNKDAQGSCTKCHSVDDIQGRGRIVNFSPPSVESKQGRFTNFIHEPHFQAVGIGQRIGILENHGCLTCHNLEKGRPYLKSYEQGHPQNFVSNFGTLKKDLCQTCHNSSTARQDCLLCHKYHVNGVSTPIMNTRIPTQ